MEYASLIKEFGNRYGMDDLVPNENGGVGFAVDGRTMTLRHQVETDDVIAMIEIVDVPEAGVAAVNRLLMQANQALFIQDGLMLILQAETGKYCLLARFGIAALDFIGFDEKLGRFLERADQWGEFFAKFFPLAAEAEARGDDPVEMPSDFLSPLEMMRV